MTPAEQLGIEHACAKLVARYANLNDAGNFVQLSELYTDDGQMARPSAPRQMIVGRAAILAALQARPPRQTRHLCTNVVIDVIDAHSAQGECAIALYVSDQQVRVGAFRDKFTLTGTGWRFSERCGSMTFG